MKNESSDMPVNIGKGEGNISIGIDNLNSLNASVDKIDVVSEKSTKKHSKRRKWLLIVVMTIILFTILAIVYLTLLRKPTKHVTLSSQSSDAASGINNVSQLKAARGKLQNIVQPISTETNKLETLK